MPLRTKGNFTGWVVWVDSLHLKQFRASRALKKFSSETDHTDVVQEPLGTYPTGYSTALAGYPSQDISHWLQYCTSWLSFLVVNISLELSDFTAQYETLLLVCEIFPTILQD